MTEWNKDNNTIMKSTMKKLLIAIVAMIAAALSFAACSDNYDETPPLASDYLTKYIMPDGVFLGNEDWTQIGAEEDEYNAFLSESK